MDALIAGAQKLVERFDCSMQEAIEVFTAALDAHDEQAAADDREASRRASLRLVKTDAASEPR